MSAKTFVALVALTLCAAGGRAAVAHPHIWIDVSAKLQFDKGQVSAIRFQWIFDDLFSAGVIGEFDKNGNKAFDADEIEPLRTGAFEGTKDSGFFTTILNDADKIDIQTTTDFAARIEKNLAVYEFTVPLREPIDPAKLSISVFDISYFVDVAFQGHDPIKLMGDGSANCNVAIEQDRLNPIFGGAVYPKKARLLCAKSQ